MNNSPKTQSKPEENSGYRVDVIQYMRPNGRKVMKTTKLPMDSLAAYQDMRKHGCNFGAEVLMSGMVSMTIEDPKNEMDVDIEVIAKGKYIQKSMVAMLNRGKWRDREAAREY